MKESFHLLRLLSSHPAGWWIPVGATARATSRLARGQARPNGGDDRDQDDDKCASRRATRGHDCLNVRDGRKRPACCGCGAAASCVCVCVNLLQALACRRLRPATAAVPIPYVA